MRIEIIVSDPWELTSDVGPTLIIGGVGALPHGHGTLRLEVPDGQSLGGKTIASVEVTPGHVGEEWVELERGGRITVRGAAFGDTDDPISFLGAASLANAPS